MIDETEPILSGSIEKPLLINGDMVYKYGYITTNEGVYYILSSHESHSDSYEDKMDFIDHFHNPYTAIVAIRKPNERISGYYLIARDRVIFRKKSKSSKSKLQRKTTKPKKRVKK